MRKITYILSLLFTLIFHACMKDKDENASTKLEKALRECQTILEGEPNGWILTYSFGVDIPSGEYTYLILFKNGEATLSSDNAFNDNYSGITIDYNDKISSSYKLSINEGVTLSFDSYNSIIHHFATPSQSLPNGYQADYEFTLISITKDKIILKGRKYGKVLEMVPNRNSSDWAEYLKLKASVDEKMPSTFYYLVIDDKQIEIISLTRAFSTKNEQTPENNFHSPYRITNNGIQLLQPLNILGYTFQNFILEELSSSKKMSLLKCLDAESSNIYIEMIILPLNQHLDLYRWFIQESNLSDLLKSKWKIAQEGMTENELNIDFAYLGPSHLIDYPGNSITFSISDGVYVGYMLNFTTYPDETMISFDFKSDGKWGDLPFSEEYLKPFMQYMCDNSPYHITEANNLIQPSKMLLTSTKNDNVWFYIER